MNGWLAFATVMVCMLAAGWASLAASVARWHADRAGAYAKRAELALHRIEELSP